MANREALRELQARLASRLQAARTEGMSVAWLAVRAGGRNYLFPLGQSGEIFPLANLQSVPYARAWFRGVLNIRGGLFGVVDLAAYVAEDGIARNEPASTEPSVVTLNAALDVNCALQVDGLLGLRGADAFSSSSAAEASAPAYFGNRFVDAAGEHWQEVNLRTLSQTSQFLSISA
ncbi:chemotaxis protein CheW [Rhodoferax saidenbachensis]|uniref:Chemotaxis protein CheW n=1 Tax=Rhodoferax saidenbachensis TaxID=1484693 RepID=A0A1P8KDC2_9BURK|nr:chemotaxis protein CheW [Rhodoferax saidenbachensis]APW44037.1 chemotaxis protein CheW [Rhodoferax saidenbachensis]